MGNGIPKMPSTTWKYNWNLTFHLYILLHLKLFIRNGIGTWYQCWENKSGEPVPPNQLKEQPNYLLQNHEPIR